MEKWKNNINEGNTFFKDKEFDKAISAYQSSKERVMQLFDHWLNPEEVVAAVLASYHNISELHIQNNRKYLAFIELQQARTFLNKKKAALDHDSDRSLALQRGIDKNEVEILTFINKHHLKPTLQHDRTLVLNNKNKPSGSMINP